MFGGVATSLPFHLLTLAVLHAGNVARGAKINFQNMRVGKVVYDVLTFQKCRVVKDPLPDLFLP